MLAVENPIGRLLVFVGVEVIGATGAFLMVGVEKIGVEFTITEDFDGTYAGSL